jgi:tRNA pseudouridine38-40 synthase
MEVAYDGSAFHGFVIQPGLPTVEETLADTITRLTGAPIKLSCAGRTDAGVHARGQVVSFELPDDLSIVETRALEIGIEAPISRRVERRLELGWLQRGINKLCRPAIAVNDIQVVGDDFDARFSAQARRYRYTVLNRSVPDPFLAATSWWVSPPLDLHALVLACDPLIGEHDFTSFCKRPLKGGTRRRVIDASWEDAGDGVLHFWIEANAFCHQMVRSIVGTVVEAGLIRKHAGDIMAIMAAQDRSLAGTPAPPHGLCLWEVRY